MHLVKSKKFCQFTVAPVVMLSLSTQGVIRKIGEQRQQPTGEANLFKLEILRLGYTSLCDTPE